MASKKAAQKSLSLAPVLDLNEATALHKQLMGLKGSPLVIDASAVERVGALIERHTELPLPGLPGAPRVNVLALNLALDQAAGVAGVASVASGPESGHTR